MPLHSYCRLALKASTLRRFLLLLLFYLFILLQLVNSFSSALSPQGLVVPSPGLQQGNVTVTAVNPSQVVPGTQFICYKLQQESLSQTRDIPEVIRFPIKNSMRAAWSDGAFADPN